MSRTLRFARMVAPAILAFGVAACSQRAASSSTTESPVEKTFTVTPTTASMKTDFLTGQLQDLTVTESVDKTGKIVDAPQLRGTLKIKNTSSDQAAQLLGAKILFLDAKGQTIPVGKDRGDNTFTFSYDGQRLDPGQETSQSFNVPFPRAGLQANDLKSVSLSLSYLPNPYRQQTVNYPVSVKG